MATGRTSGARRNGRAAPARFLVPSFFARPLFAGLRGLAAFALFAFLAFFAAFRVFVVPRPRCVALARPAFRVELLFFAAKIRAPADSVSTGGRRVAWRVPAERPGRAYWRGVVHSRRPPRAPGVVAQAPAGSGPTSQCASGSRSIGSPSRGFEIGACWTGIT
jgi:hypothetical protein